MVLYTRIVYWCYLSPYFYWYCVLVLHFYVTCGADVYWNKGQPYYTRCVPAGYKNYKIYISWWQWSWWQQCNYGWSLLTCWTQWTWIRWRPQGSSLSGQRTPCRSPPGRLGSWRKSHQYISSYITILYIHQLPEGDHVRKVNGGTTDQEVIIPALINQLVFPQNWILGGLGRC